MKGVQRMTSNIIIIKLLLFIARCVVFKSDEHQIQIDRQMQYCDLLNEVDDHIKELEVD